MDPVSAVKAIGVLRRGTSASEKTVGGLAQSTPARMSKTIDNFFMFSSEVGQD